MSTQRFTPEFKQEAVRQVVERGYPVAEVAERVGVSAHSLYKWVKAVAPDKTERQISELLEAKSEILKLRAQLQRTEEERDILKSGAVLRLSLIHIFMTQEAAEAVTSAQAGSRTQPKSIDGRLGDYFDEFGGCL